MTEEQVGVRAWLERITAEYREMPGLNLTKPQMRRLWTLDRVVCDAIVDALLAAGVLRRTERDTFVANA